MKAFLVRVGIDSESGHWNAPINTQTFEFAYIPIPESQPIKPGYEISYQQFKPVCSNLGKEIKEKLNKQFAHLDPDFSQLTYGDQGNRGAPLIKLLKGDLVAFYGAFKPTNIDCGKTGGLIYALFGLYVVERVTFARQVDETICNMNAHTRRQTIDNTDIIVVGQKGKSGRFKKAIPIGEYRKEPGRQVSQYYVAPQYLEEWGGLTVQNGWIQRSATLPEFKDPVKFYSWFNKQDVTLIERNNE
jgi:hypothetical protein